MDEDLLKYRRAAERSNGKLVIVPQAEIERWIHAKLKDDMLNTFFSGKMQGGHIDLLKELEEILGTTIIEDFSKRWKVARNKVLEADRNKVLEAQKQKSVTEMTAKLEAMILEQREKAEARMKEWVQSVKDIGISDPVFVARANQLLNEANYLPTDTPS